MGRMVVFACKTTVSAMISGETGGGRHRCLGRQQPAGRLVRRAALDEARLPRAAVTAWNSPIAAQRRDAEGMRQSVRFDGD
jgi:hypothetical protein